MTDRKKQIQHLLKGIETGDPSAVEVINPDKYIQHNPQTHVERDGLAKLFKELSKTSPRVNIVRIFEDGDYVFGHTEYDFARSRVGFEVFRFEGSQTVEHWDNIQARKGPNASGHSMVDGATEVSDLAMTENNRTLVRTFIDKVMIQGHLDQLSNYVDEALIQHNPGMTDGLLAVCDALENQDPKTKIRYEHNHRVLAQGNFVLSVSEGYLGEAHTAFYDLFRVAGGKLVEHWDTIETVPPRSEWKNQNGKF